MMEMHADFRFATNMARACSHGCCALSLPSAHNRTGKLSMKGSRKDSGAFVVRHDLAELKLEASCRGSKELGLSPKQYAASGGIQ
jgi:hypothetical protein